jgi:sterol desaturase/sphingolipid hydroxylase (fatty acid hydroxylase superfamily)
MVIASPCLVALPVDALTAFVFLIGALVNGRIWSAIHSEMHRPSDAWLSTMRVYNFLKLWRFLHHRHPGTNFNTAFPMWDWFLGTIAVMTEEDRKEIEMGTWRVRPTLAERLGASGAERF